jgi:hypothetical protein
MPPYLVLLRMGFAVPSALPRPRCALTAPFHPCLCLAAIGGLFSVALSVALGDGANHRSLRPAVSRHPALWSPDFPLHCRSGTATVWLASRARSLASGAPASVDIARSSRTMARARRPQRRFRCAGQAVGSRARVGYADPITCGDGSLGTGLPCSPSATTVPLRRPGCRLASPSRLCRSHHLR